MGTRVEESSCKGCTEEGGNEEQPHLLKPLSAHKDGGPEGSCGVDGDARDWDGDYVDGGEGEADRDAGVHGAAFLARGAQDDDDEDEGEDKLGEKGRSDLVPLRWGMGRVVVVVMMVVVGGCACRRGNGGGWMAHSCS